MGIRRIVPLLLMLLLIASACSKPARKLPEPEAPRPVVLKIAMMYEFAALNALMEGYRESHPHVTFEKLPLDNSSVEVYRTNLLAGDIMYGHPQTIRAGMLDLAPYLARHKVEKSLYGGGFDGAVFAGGTVGVPILVSALMIPVNKEMAAEAGVSIPGEGWTWDEFRAAAAKLTSRTGTGFLPALNSPVIPWVVNLYIEQKIGRPAYETDEQALTEALSFFSTMANTDHSLKVVPMDGRVKLTAAFEAGEAAMGVTYGGMIKPPPLPFGVEWAPMPYHRPSARLTMGSFGYLSIRNREGTDAEAAWEFLAYAISPEGARQVAKSGFLPAYQTAEFAAWLKQTYPQAPAVAFTLYETRFIPDRTLSDSSVRKQQALDLAIERVLSGAAPVEVAVADWKKTVEPLK